TPLVLLVGLCLAIARPAAAQRTQAVSDALVMAQPGGAQTRLIIVFPKVVSHTQARKRIAQIAAANGWQGRAAEVKDQDVTTVADRAAGRSDVQTGAVAILTNAPMMREGGFTLQPFLAAFSDLNRVEVLFCPEKPLAHYPGLRDFQSDAVTVRL